MKENIPTSNLAEITVKYSSKVKSKDRRNVTCARDAEALFREVWNTDTIELREEFYILFLNRANRLLGWMKVAEGGITGTVCDPRIIFAIALKSVASSIILAHNHPSGNTEPSQSDIALTNKLIEGGKLLEITVLDHLIITKESQYSFAENGLIKLTNLE
ncbi:MAG: DNA repair protein [Bacteroidetes bacterium]|nr:MAG: DNA repair protein [Bacteroidota bacterium]REK06675.1 MAG: DNA repair protein [Bacteroidota bacterium]REK33440.1 MAG: DNA repair protein [Bacteroidota bacterium]REK49832.1 MAG: DNA repair protein [Bacteroidota bacterium]